MPERPRLYGEGTATPADDPATWQRFQDIWIWCMTVHEVGTLPGGPCMECVGKYAKDGPPPIPKPIPQVVFRAP